VRTLERVAADRPLSMNDIARVRIRTQRPLALDAYARNRVTGAFIVIDEASNHTVAAGTVATDPRAHAPEASSAPVAFDRARADTEGLTA
jgi:sulfate adenylyltransferase subunit 1 (EFTu-like GTPase family)